MVLHCGVTLCKEQTYQIRNFWCEIAKIRNTTSGVTFPQAYTRNSLAVTG